MIIGITGTNGSGKGTVVDYLKQKGFKHYSARKYIEAEIVRRGMPIDRTSMNIVGNDMRAKYGFDYWDRVFFQDLGDFKGDVIFESIRNLAGAKRLKEKGVFILAVDADRKLRYERAVLRGSSADKVSFEEFCAQEDREMAQTAEHDMNVFGVMKIADYTVHNDGTLAELHAQIDRVFSQIKK